MLRTASVPFDEVEPPSRGRRGRTANRPLTLRREHGRGYVVVDGHEKYDAAERVGAHRLFCLIREEDTNDPLDALAEIRGVGGRDPIEEAGAIVAALDVLRVSQRELAAMTGLGQPYISKRKRLLTLSPRVQALVRERRITLEEALGYAKRSGTDSGTREAKRNPQSL